MPEESTTGRKYPLGVLFVHGIGEQPEGDTLLGFGDPIIRFLRRWLTGGDPKRGGELTVEKSVLTPSRLHKRVPPHSKVRVRVPDSGREQVWLWAESWWGGDVQPPAFGRMAVWMMTVGAWSILAHFTKHIVFRTPTPVRFVRYVLALLAWIVLASLLQILVVTLSILRILPIPGTRKALADVLVTLTGVLGDSYVLIESDLQRAAIVDKTRDALLWVSERCESVIVIAHSQGAAIAHLALRMPGPDNVRTLFTFGSGLGKLEELLRLRDRPREVRLAAQLTPLFLLLVALLVRVAFFEERNSETNMALWVLGMTALFASIWGTIVAELHWERVEEWLPQLKLVRPEFCWLDVFASRDPVPNGELSPRLTPIATRTRRIRNLASFLGDHTSYWQNRTEFVPIVAKEIVRCAGLPMFDQPGLDRIEEAAAAHERHVVWLALTSWGCAAAVALAVLLHPMAIRTVGKDAQQGLEALGGVSSKGLHALSAAVGWFIPNRPPDVTLTVPQIQQIVLGTLIAILAITLWKRAYQVIWQAWDESTIDRITDGRTIHPVDRLMVDAFSITAGFAPLILVVIWPWLRDIVVGRAIARFTLGIYVAMVVAIVGVMISTFVKAWPHLRADEAEKRGQAYSEIKKGGMAVGALLLSSGILLPIFFPGLKPFQKFSSPLLAVFAYVSVIVAVQRKAIARLGTLTSRASIRVAASIGPGVLTALSLASMVPVYLRATSSDLDGSATLLYLLFTVYFVAIGGVWLVCWMLQWQRARGASAELSSVARNHDEPTR